MNATEIARLVSIRESKKRLYEEQLVDLKKDIDKCTKKYDVMVEARRIMAEASRRTQMQFKVFVETLVTMAIQTVFPTEGYRFVIEFDLKSNRNEINLLVQQNDKEPYRPEDEQGGGLLDIISFALRVVMWSLEKPRSRPVFIMDEPFRFCGALTPLAGNMMREISNKLNIQMIMVTHDLELKDIGDKCWIVQREKGGSSEVIEQGNVMAEIIEKPKTKIKRRK